MPEVIVTEKTVEAAIELGCSQLGKERDDVEYEILEMPKKGLFGKLKAPAKVRVYFEEEEDILAAIRNPQPFKAAPKSSPVKKTEPKATSLESKERRQEEPKPTAPTQAQQAAPVGETQLAKLEAAKAYIKDILAAMGINMVEFEESVSSDGAMITLVGEDLGVIIGRRGETLDALQYLASLACNKLGGDYFRITVDCGNFRQKREKTLQELAAKIARNVLRSGRSCTLEPMNPYERRIIHAVISDTPGVLSKSVGEEPYRKVVISAENSRRGGYDRRRSGGNNRRPYRNDSRREGCRPAEGDNQPNGESQPAESKAPAVSREETPAAGKLYSKIEL